MIIAISHAIGCLSRACFFAAGKVEIEIRVDKPASSTIEGILVTSSRNALQNVHI